MKFAYDLKKKKGLQNILARKQPQYKKPLVQQQDIRFFNLNIAT